MAKYSLHIFTIILLLFSYYKNPNKTKIALRKAWKALENILPEFLGVIMLVGILLSLVNPELISNAVGEKSGWLGVILSALVGSIALIPGIVAFPTAALLLQSGAGYMQIGAFISSLMMVGVVTAPVETKYFGKKLTIIRNTIAFFFSFFAAYIIGKVVSGI